MTARAGKTAEECGKRRIFPPIARFSCLIGQNVCIFMLPLSPRKQPHPHPLPTPALLIILYSMRRIYLDNAATTPIADEVLEVMTRVMREEYGNPSSIHAEGRRMRAAIEEARKTIARCTGAGTGEIFFTSGGTESNNMAIKCAVRDLGVRRIISSPLEHHCVLHAVERMGLEGVEVKLLPVDAAGRVSLEALETWLSQPDAPVTLVSLMYANNEIGTLLPFERVAALCAQYGAYFHSDTVQAVGHFPLNVQNVKVHFISGAAHKFHGPKGVGFIYIRSDVKLRPYIDGGAQERNMRGGTENACGIIGMAKALQLACDEMEARKAHIIGLRRFMAAQLKEAISGIRFNGPESEDETLYTVLNVSFPPSPKNEMLLFALDIAGISASGGSACSSGSERGSHVLEAIGADPARKSVRFSFSHFNTEEEIVLAVEKIKEIVTK